MGRDAHATSARDRAFDLRAADADAMSVITARDEMRSRFAFFRITACLAALTLASAPAFPAEKPGCGCGTKIATRENIKPPKAVRTYLAANLTGYEAVSEADYEEVWLDNQDLHWTLQADFDGNGKADYALLMKKDGEVALVVVRRMNDGYTHDILEPDLCDIPVVATLRIQPKGHTNIAAPDATAAEMKYFWNPAIRIGILETDIDLRWYWEEGKWHAI
ncbi:MAG: hypothetical protein IT364_05710 [Candidatus Hydrogenedentes bacterium]|nr:hypothetical protein [Candidatus Hydrogenedentota bacterium]